MKRFALALSWLVLASAAAGAPAPAGMPDVPDVLLSRQLVERTGLHVGDIVTLADLSGSRSARFRLTGVYEPTPDPMRFTVPQLAARLHLPDLIALTEDPADPAASESVGAINVALADPADALPVAEQVSARMPGLVARPTARAGGRGDLFAVLDRFHLAIAIVTVLGSTAFLLALMVMRADERRETIGILRLIGVSPRSILLEVLFEGLLVGLAGALFGVAVAVAGEGIVNRVFQARYDTTLVFVRVTGRIAAESVALAIPLGIAAGVVASWKLLRRNAIALVRR